MQELIKRGVRLCEPIHKKEVFMPTKHVDDETWRKIEIKTVQEVVRTRKSIKETEMLKRLILIGLKHYDDEQFIKKEENQ